MPVTGDTEEHIRQSKCIVAVVAVVKQKERRKGIESHEISLLHLADGLIPATAPPPHAETQPHE